MSEIDFEYPQAFLILALFILCSIFCKARSEAILFPHLDIFIKQRAKESALIKFFKWLSIIGAVTALASPVIKNRVQLQKRDAHSLVLAIDASGSMSRGFGERYISHRKRAKESKFSTTVRLAKAFIKERKGDQIGIVVFGGFAYTAAPLTLDKEILSKILDSLQVGSAGINATVINDALFQSAKLFENSKAKSKVVILLTDGESRGDHIPYRVVSDYLKRQKIKVYTVGIGDERDFNKAFLEQIAKDSKGERFIAKSAKDLKEIYHNIDKLQKSKVESTKYIKKRYLYEYPLFIALMALLFWTYLTNKRGVVA